MTNKKKKSQQKQSPKGRLHAWIYSIDAFHIFDPQSPKKRKLPTAGQLLKRISRVLGKSFTVSISSHKTPIDNTTSRKK